MFYHHFNTSHVTVYHNRADRGYCCNVISIHLMLRFIKINLWCVFILVNISIHLMLRFIAWIILKFARKADFNTSHVTVYRKLFVAVKVWYPNFNTSHVTVYLSGYYWYQGIQKAFQYISCYGLSKWDWFVTLTFSEFQYISCYGLSFELLGMEWERLKFQYISCYGLSLPVEVVNKTVFEFQYISCYGLSKCSMSNTIKHIQFQYISCYGLSF